MLQNNDKWAAFFRCLLSHMFSGPQDVTHVGIYSCPRPKQDRQVEADWGSDTQTYLRSEHAHKCSSSGKELAPVSGLLGDRLNNVRMSVMNAASLCMNVNYALVSSALRRIHPQNIKHRVSGGDSNAWHKNGGQLTQVKSTCTLPSL